MDWRAAQIGADIAQNAPAAQRREPAAFPAICADRRRHGREPAPRPLRTLQRLETVEPAPIPAAASCGLDLFGAKAFDGTPRVVAAAGSLAGGIACWRRSGTIPTGRTARARSTGRACGTAAPATLRASAGRESFVCRCAVGVSCFRRYCRHLEVRTALISRACEGGGGPFRLVDCGAPKSRGPFSPSLRTASPRDAGNGQAKSFSRCIRIRVLPPRKPFQIPPSQKKGGGAPKERTAGSRTLRCGARPCLRPLPFAGDRAWDERARSPFGAPPRLPRLCPRLGSGQRFLEPPDANGRTLSGTSAASTSQSGTGRTGLMPKAARARSVSPRPREPLPLRLQEYPREGVLRERDGSVVT